MVELIEVGPQFCRAEDIFSRSLFAGLLKISLKLCELHVAREPDRLRGLSFNQRHEQVMKAREQSFEHNMRETWTVSSSPFFRLFAMTKKCIKK